MTESSFWLRFYLAFRFPLAIALVIELVGSLGYWVISDYQATLIDQSLRGHDLDLSPGLEDFHDQLAGVAEG